MSLPDPFQMARQPMGALIFWSRWLQAPLYFGLIVAQAVYVYHFIVELWHLISQMTKLLIMVIVGGYETFVSRLRLEGHPDQPEWLSHVNAGVLKVKLATALIGISSIHLLKTFIEVDRLSEKAMIFQIVIHLTFVISAFCLAWTDRITMVAAKAAAVAHERPERVAGA